MATKKTVKTSKPSTKKASSKKSSPIVKRGCGSRPGEPRRKVTTSIAKQIVKLAAKQEAKEGKNVAAIARQFELSTVTINNVLNNTYGYL
jgi:DNA invertase Pin-like site-specific DNA recombinase